MNYEKKYNRYDQSPEKIGNADLDVESILDEAYKVLGGMDIFSGLSFGGDVIPDYNKMYQEQATLIRKLAQLSGGVFLGRCADAVLADQKDCYHIFIYVSDEFRKKRSHDFYGDMTLKEMELEDAAELILQYIERVQK